MSNNKQIEKKLKLPHRETVISTNTLQTKPFDNQKIEIMSNNKQSMKLYTEEQVIDAINKSFVIEYPSTGNDILNELIPIILPSDEEIQKESLKSDFEYTFRNGAKWMRDKIQGGNNEQQ